MGVQEHQSKQYDWCFTACILCLSSSNFWTWFVSYPQTFSENTFTTYLS